MTVAHSFISGAFAEKRVALVIGNSNYEYALPLRNPKNDADDLASALRRLNFGVTKGIDLTTAQFDQAVEEFVVAARNADVALFFFSGHGVQIDKRGYLAPVNAKVETESRAVRELVTIQEVVSRIENAAKVSVIVLDACRDSPLHERLRRIALEKDKALIPPKGLPPVSVVGSNTLIVYATVPGETASDGDGRNSPFTSSLLKHIETPGLEVELMFKRVTADVLKETGGKQQPERLSRLQSELMLANSTQALLSRSPNEPQPPLSEAARTWTVLQNSQSEAVFEEFIRRFPDSPYAGFAKARLDELKRMNIVAKTKFDTKLPSSPMKPESERPMDQSASGADLRRQPINNTTKWIIKTDVRPEIEDLIREGNKRFREGNVLGARLFYQKAVLLGDAEAALAMGRSYDPIYFARADGKRNSGPDAAIALDWYSKAGERGAAQTAKVRIGNLKSFLGEQPVQP